jgi:hypothetical protein
VKAGLSDVARELAGAALLALSDKKLEMAMEGCQKHVMLSYQWSYQPTVKRINESLKARGYVTWAAARSVRLQLAAARSASSTGTCMN